MQINNNQGSIVVVSLVIATAVLLLLGVFLGSIVAERKNVQRSYYAVQALHLAEAGVEKTIWALNNEEVDSNPWTTNDTVEISGKTVGTFEVTVTSSATGATVVATGEVEQVTRKVEVVMERKAIDVFDYALFSDEGGIQLVENAYVDSYDSRSGSYQDQAAVHPDGYYAISSATVGTNSISPSTVSLSDNASIYGDAAVGPGGDPSVAIEVTDNAKITGSQETINSEVELPEVQPPTEIDFDHSGTSLKVKANEVVEINNPGVYRYDSISVAGNGVLRISAPSVKIYVESDVNVEVDITGNGVIEIATGCSVIFYIGGNMKIAGNGVVNYNQDPTTLAVYGTDKCERIQFVGNADFYGIVYARKAEISVTGNGGVYGSLVGDKIYISGNGGVHYDEALLESDEIFPSWATYYEMIAWYER